MPNAGNPWPRKTRELQNHHMDSTVWNEVKFRGDDIIIATYAKAGTTWLQQIISQLLFDGATDMAVAEMSPWIDLRLPPRDVKLSAIEAQTHRRFLKTHLPVDALVYSPGAKYIYIGRDGRDVIWSFYNHHVHANEIWYDALNNTPGRVGPPIGRPAGTVRDYYLEWLEKDGFPIWPFWENIRSWWEIRELPNLMLLHFNDLKADMGGQIRRMAAFLEIDIDEETWPAILEHCSFDYMKKHAARSVPMGGAFWDGGADTFVHKGTNGRWRDILSDADNKLYEQTAGRELDQACAHWLATGERGD